MVPLKFHSVRASVPTPSGSSARAFMSRFTMPSSLVSPSTLAPLAREVTLTWAVPWILSFSSPPVGVGTTRVTSRTTKPTS